MQTNESTKEELEYEDIVNKSLSVTNKGRV